MLWRPWSQRPSGIASRKAVSAGRAVSRPRSLPDAPRRSRNTGRNVPAAVTMPMNTESICTTRQFAAWIDGGASARADLTAKVAIGHRHAWRSRIQELDGALLWLVVGLWVQLDRRGTAPAPAQVEGLDEDAEAHGRVDVRLVDVQTEPIGDQRHADEQEEREREHLDRRVLVHELRERPRREEHHA